MLVVTLGDPLSCNVEILAQVLRQRQLLHVPVLVIGSYLHWHQQMQRLNFEDIPWQAWKSLNRPTLPGWYFYNTDDTETVLRTCSAEQLSPLQRGHVALEALQCVARLTADQQGPIAVLTMPIDKAAAKQAGFGFPGQTEFFQHIWDGQAVMMLAGPCLRVALATNHLALSQVAENLSSDVIEVKLSVLAEGLQSIFGIAQPRIAVCGLNPHCGEQGLFGNEEQRLIQPAIDRFNVRYHRAQAYGPLSADTVFFQAYHGTYDAVLAMYHDQGLAPLKTVHFYDAVNVSAGLRHLRLSPDHGPARDRFLKKSADINSTLSAWDLCCDYLHRQSETAPRNQNERT